MADEIDLKKLLRSKTFYFNLLIIALGIIELIQAQLAAGASFTIIGLIGMVLRVLTKSAVTKE